MKIHILLTMLFFASAASAFTLPAGTCQNFTLFNSTDNSSFVEEWCADAHPTAVQAVVLDLNATHNASAFLSLLNGTVNVTINASGNLTVIQNVTVQNNTTIVQGCNATNETLWANSTGTFNNATITCLANGTVRDVPTFYCPQSNTTLTANATTTINNQTFNCIGAEPGVSCPSQSVNRQIGTNEVFRNDVCNITIIGPPPTTCSASSCPDGLSCQGPCQQCQACAAPVVCKTEDELCGNVKAQYEKTIENYNIQLQSAQATASNQQNLPSLVNASVSNAVKPVETKQEGLENVILFALVVFFGGGAALDIHSRQQRGGLGVPKVITKEEHDKFKENL